LAPLWALFRCAADHGLEQNQSGDRAPNKLGTLMMTRAWRRVIDRDRVRDPALTAMLVVECLLIFVAAPCVSFDFPGARIPYEVGLLTFIALLGLVSRSRLAGVVGALALVVAVIGAALNLTVPGAPGSAITHAAGLIAALSVCYVVSNAVFAPGVITGHRVRGAVVLYLTLGIVFASAYRIILEFAPTALSGIPPGTPSWKASGSILYFSFITLTSIGFGDIVPVHPIARSLTNLEGIIGQLFPATLLARLVTLELEARRRP